MLTPSTGPLPGWRGPSFLRERITKGLIEAEDLEVQNRHIGHPEEIRDHQTGGEAFHIPEIQRNEEDGGPETKGDDERGHNLVELEENESPQSVQGELNRKEDQTGAAKFGVGAVFGSTPDQPRGDRHQSIKRSPDGSEEPIGRSKVGLGKGGVPGGKRWRCDGGTERGNSVTGYKQAQENSGGADGGLSYAGGQGHR